MLVYVLQFSRPDDVCNDDLKKAQEERGGTASRSIYWHQWQRVAIVHSDLSTFVGKKKIIPSPLNRVGPRANFIAVRIPATQPGMSHLLA
jgi:hypothetical protein